MDECDRDQIVKLNERLRSMQNYLDANRKAWEEIEERIDRLESLRDKMAGGYLVTIAAIGAFCFFAGYLAKVYLGC